MKLIAYAIILLFVALMVSAQEPVAGGKDLPEPYRSWNVCVRTIKEEGDFETGLWPQLQQSYQADPPQHVKSLDRAAIIKQLIELHKERLRALERMLEAEKQ